MSNKLLTICALLLGLNVGAANQQVTAHLVFTNNANVSAVCSITVNGVTMLFTNNVSASPSTQILIGTYPSNSAAYAYTNFITYPFTASGGPIIATYDLGTNITLTGPWTTGNPFTIAILPNGGANGWGTNSFTTNNGANLQDVQVPLSGAQAVPQTNLPTLLAIGMGTYSLAPFATNTTLMQNFVDTNNTQTIGGAKTFLGPIFGSGANTFSNTGQLWDYGTISNTTIQSFTNTDIAHFEGALTNDTFNWGISSSGFLTIPGVESIGTTLKITNSLNSRVFPDLSFQNLTGTTTYTEWTFGSASQTNWELQAQVPVWEIINHVTGNTADLVINSNDMVNIPFLVSTNTNSLVVNSTLNNNAFGGTNAWQGDLAYTGLSISSLANGNNADINVSTNVYCRLSGPTANVAIVGIAGGRDGRILRLSYAGMLTGTNWTILNNSGVESTAANRILTGIGATITMTNNPAVVDLIYDGSQNLWVVANHSN